MATGHMPVRKYRGGTIVQVSNPAGYEHFMFKGAVYENYFSSKHQQ